MTGLGTFAAVLAFAALAAGLRTLLRRRRFSLRHRFAMHPVALGGAGGRALASHVQAISDLGMYLEAPPARR
jgi:hypothetical protein